MDASARIPALDLALGDLHRPWLALVFLGQRSIADPMAALIALVTVGLIWKVKKLPEPALVGITAIVGLVAFPGLRS